MEETMKKLSLVLIVLLSLLALVSCDTAEVESATLRIEMNNSRRTIGPEDSENLDIYGYKVIAVSPDGKESEPYYTYYSYINLEGLSLGTWTIKVYGFNSDRQDLSYGQGEISLISGKNTLSVDLIDLVGEGDLSVTLDWSASGLENVATVKTVFKDQGGKEITLTPSTPVGYQSTIIHTNLPAGSYTLQVELLDRDGNKLQGLTEAVRISNGAESKAELKFLNTSSGDGASSATVTISDRTSTPVEVQITGVETLIEAGRAFTASISIPANSAVREKDINAVWHLDGKEMGKGTQFTFPNGVSAGWHRIDVVTSTGEAGSLGSSSITFQAASSTSPGDPYQKITISSGEQFTLGTDTVMHFLPNNYLLVASNQYRTVQLLDITAASTRLCAEYTYDELKIGDYKVADFATSGTKYDSYYSVIFVCNSTSSCKAVNLMVSKTQITYTDEATEYDKRVTTDKACQFVNITEANNFLVATIQNTTRTRMGYVAFNINPEKGRMINRDDNYITNPNMDFCYSGFKNISSLPESGYFVVISGQKGKVIKCQLKDSTEYAAMTEYHLWTSYDDYVDSLNKQTPVDDFKDGFDCGFLTSDGQFAFVVSTEGIYYYKRNANTFYEYEYYLTEPYTEGSIGAVKMCRDVKYGYMIDSTNKSLVTLTPTEDDGCYVLKKGTSIPLDSGTYNEIDISKDGKYLVVYNADDCTAAHVIKASR